MVVARLVVVAINLALCPTFAQLSANTVYDLDTNVLQFIDTFKFVLNNTNPLELGPISPDRYLNVSERLTRYGYHAEEHTVVTEDGYVLLVNRVYKYRPGAPVLVMHGLIQSADTWTESGREAGLAYFLADLGYDVWLGNVRGSPYSRTHIIYSTSDKSYWEFSRDEMGRYDLPAMFDKVLSETRSTQLSYIGFFQGAGMFYMMCDVVPEYCNKAKIMISLAPSTRHTFKRSPFLRPLSVFVNAKEDLLTSLGMYELLYKGGPFQSFFNKNCPSSSLGTGACLEFTYFVDGRHEGSILGRTINNLVANFPAGTSVRNFAAYGQAMLTKRFQKNDYGFRNLQMYGVPYPPEYNLRAVTAPVVVLSGRNDGISDIRDVRWAVKQLPNLLEYKEVEEDRWILLDNTYSRLAPIYIFPTIKHYLSVYN